MSKRIAARTARRATDCLALRCIQQVQVGARCLAGDGDCADGLECRRDLVGERPLCTREYDDDCPKGRTCVSGLTDYNGKPLPSLCMLECPDDQFCSPIGSECGMPGTLTQRYCF